MADTSSIFAGSVPELYDRYFGPAVFEPYAADPARLGGEAPFRSTMRALVFTARAG
jgi:hypothetical protein